MSVVMLLIVFHFFFVCDEMVLHAKMVVVILTKDPHACIYLTSKMDLLPYTTVYIHMLLINVHLCVQCIVYMYSHVCAYMYHRISTISTATM